MVDGDVFRVREAAESAAAQFARASRPTKVVLQKSSPRRLLPLQIAEETDADMDKVHPWWSDTNGPCSK